MNCSSENEYRKMLNKLYARVKTYNNKLLEKSNNESYDNAKYDEVIHFAITCNALSAIKNYFEGIIHTDTAYLNLRNIIEYYALLKVYIKGQIDKNRFDIFKKQYCIIEYKNYKFFDSKVSKEFIDLNRLKTDYDNVIKMIEHFGVKDVDSIVNSKIPFMLNPNVTYDSLIKDNCFDLYSLYGLLSKNVHPNSYFVVRKLTNQEVKKVLDIVFDLYNNKPASCKVLSFDKEKQLIYGNEIPSINNYGLLLRNILMRQIVILDFLFDSLNKAYSKETYLARFIKNLKEMTFDINTDIQFGYCENAKMKLKIVLEKIAMFDKTYFNTDLYNVDYFYDMSVLRERYNEISLYTTEKRDLLKKAYDLYKNKYQNSSVNEKDFELKFKKMLGHLINEEGIIPTYHQIVKDVLKQIYGNSKVKANKILNRHFYFMSYIESLNMSHGQGYLYFTNMGAWNDGINVLTLIDSATCYLINKIEKIFRLFSVVEKVNEPVANLFKKCLEEMEELIADKNTIITSISPVKKNF